jgi:hypothetical protein
MQDTCIDGSNQQVIGSGDGVDITSKMQIEFFLTRTNKIDEQTRGARADQSKR